MNILLVILLIVGLLLAFLFFLALITKKNYEISRSILINKPLGDVFSYVKLVRNQENYSVWVRRDPNVKINYTGTDGQVGFLSAWEGNKQAGKGEQEILIVQENALVQLALRFEKPFKNNAQTFMYTEAVQNDQTRVTWKFVGRNPFPMNLFNLIIDGVLGKDLSKSLEALKTILEETASKTSTK